MKNKLLFLQLFCVVVLSCQNFVQGQTLDQSNTSGYEFGFNVNASSNQNVGQSFTAGISGDLDSFHIRVGDVNGLYFSPGDFEFKLFSGNGTSNPLLTTKIFTVNSVPNNTYTDYVINFPTAIAIVAGNVYTVEIRSITGTALISGTENFYPLGGLYFNNGSNGLYTSYDMWFKTYIRTPTASALNFNAPDDIVTFNSTLGNFGTGDFTIEFQIKTAFAGYYILSKRGTCNNDNFLSINMSNTGKLGIETSNINVSGSNASFSGNTSLNDNIWHKVSLTRNAGILTLFVDGVQDTQIIPTTPESLNVDLNSNYVLQLGGIAPCTPYINNQVLQGSIDELRFWSRALPETEIVHNLNCELAPGQTGLLAYYKFNQGLVNSDNSATTTLIDDSGNGNTGTLSNFSLTGTTSNWVADGGVTTGITCSTFLNATDFEFSSKLSVYPNPSSDVFSINSDSSGSLVVYDVIGKIIKTETIDLGITKLDLSNYPSGIYLMKVITENNQTQTIKLIKQ